LFQDALQLPNVAGPQVAAQPLQHLGGDLADLPPEFAVEAAQVVLHQHQQVIVPLPQGGLALAGMIRQQAELSATRLILLTSGDSPGDVARARQLGISAFLLKPLQQRELMEAILRVMGHEGDPEELVASPAVERPPVPESLVGVPLRILAAEDNVFNRDLLEHMLTRLGFSAAMAVNGREALALLGIRSQESGIRNQGSILH